MPESKYSIVNKGVLVPFHYYGIYDETGYSSLHLVKGRYDEEVCGQILPTLIVNKG